MFTYVPTVGHKALHCSWNPVLEYPAGLAKGNVGTGIYWVTFISNPIYKILFSLGGLMPQQWPQLFILNPVVMTLPSHPPTQQQYVAVCSFQ